MRVNGEGRAPAREPTSSQFAARAMPPAATPTSPSISESFSARPGHLPVRRKAFAAHLLDPRLVSRIRICCNPRPLRRDSSVG